MNKELDIKIERLARDYCDKNGSVYFDYTDASNELIDAFREGYLEALKEIDELKDKLKKAEEENELIHHMWNK